MQVKRVILDKLLALIITTTTVHWLLLMLDRRRSQAAHGQIMTSALRETESAEGGPNPLAVLVRGTESAGGSGPDPL